MAHAAFRGAVTLRGKPCEPSQHPTLALAEDAGASAFSAPITVTSNTQRYQCRDCLPRSDHFSIGAGNYVSPGVVTSRWHLLAVLPCDGLEAHAEVLLGLSGDGSPCPVLGACHFAEPTLPVKVTTTATPRAFATTSVPVLRRRLVTSRPSTVSSSLGARHLQRLLGTASSKSRRHSVRPVLHSRRGDITPRGNRTGPPPPPGPLLLGVPVTHRTIKPSNPPL